MSNAHGYVYILTEGLPEEIAKTRSLGKTPEAYKVGKAEWGKRRPTDARPFLPAEERQAKAQSCNPRPVGFLRLFAFPSDSDARNAEGKFHEEHKAGHGVLAYERHEWYRPSLPIPDVVDFLSTRGGRDVTDTYPHRVLPASYEEGSCEFTKKVPGRQPLTVYVLSICDDGASWFRVLATSYPNAAHPRADVNRWYNTGNPRLVTMVRNLQPKPLEDATNRNSRVRQLMEALTNRYHAAQSPFATKPQAAWNTLAWVQSDTFLETFDELAITDGLGSLS